MDLATIPLVNLLNQIAYRLIPSKYPPRSLFDDVANHDEFEILFAIQELTNPRIRNELGNLNRVPAEQRPYGIRGCNYALGPFVHLNPAGSRFSNGDFGVYYAAEDVQTAIAETRHHQQIYFSGVVGLKFDRLTMRCLKTQFTAGLHDIRGDEFKNENWYLKDDYTAGQQLGSLIKREGMDGLAYLSVRLENKTCYALFSPILIKDVVQTTHYEYIWDGEKIVVALETTEVS
ncbi:RES family NAD+ phosphorylase [Cellvibrio sp.]|uniref:RES family NAD+ phosphorylase n=1 Tax=Cellvibrio sp. TaxID=1965322 RepID=UPI003964877B